MSEISDLEILFEDDDCVAVNKPAGMLVHPTELDRHATTTVQTQLKQQTGRRVFPAHRLDRPTSGVLIFGYSSEAVRHLGKQFEERAVSKRYLAIVRGFTEDRGRIDRALKEPIDRLSDKRIDRNKPAQDAITDYETITRSELPFSAGRYPTSRYSLVSVTPLTGRSHQIRRHLNGLTHPIIGDNRHGDHRQNRYLKDNLQIQRLMLASVELQIKLLSGETKTIQAKPGADFDRAREILELLGET